MLLADGTPAPFASVICRSANRQTVTDESGEFSFRDLPEGRHFLAYQMLGQRSKEDSIAVESGRTVFVSGNLDVSASELGEVVITGQSEPMTLKNSVYQVRTISSEKIRMRGASNLQTILNTELGIRLSNDRTLGTTDIELLGMSGQRVKVLLDGIPMPDRGEIRESIGQIDINTIERIEIVEGPMSVIYGTDALAGVLNIITKKGSGSRSLHVSARVQEETAGSEYSPFRGGGVHNESLSVTFRHKPWEVSAGLSRNNFGGWMGSNTGRARAWMPKEQLLANASLGYRTDKVTLWYRFNGTDEDLLSLGDVVPAGTTQDPYEMVTDKKYTTWRLFHQVQGDFRTSDKFSLNVAGSYTDYTRKTLTTNTNLYTGKTTLSLADGSQDRSTFTTSFGRATANYKLNDAMQLIAGADYNGNNAAGARIEGTPGIVDLAAFVTPEFKLAGEKLSLRPGARFIYNSVYQAPPVIPSINAKWSLHKNADLRVAYARGFRAPSLRELYFWFFDASHSMKGNPDLKAEWSNSYNAYLNLQLAHTKSTRLGVVVGGFYNAFRDFIDLALDARDPTLYTYLNVHKSTTTGGSANATLSYKSLQANAGLQLLGIYNELLGTEPALQLPQLNWTPELNANLIYTIKPIETSVNLSYKYTGARPLYQLAEDEPLGAVLTRTAAFHMADLSASKLFGKNLTANGGVRNLFNVTTLQNTARSSGTGHSTAGAVPMSYGRSYFLGIQYSLSTRR